MKERILQFIKANKLTVHGFEVKCNLGQGVIYKMRDNLNSDSLAKIALAYPDLDLRWLLTGQNTPTKVVTINPNEKIEAYWKSKAMTLQNQLTELEQLIEK